MHPSTAIQTTIAAIMHPHPYTVTAQQPVQALLMLFVEHGISAAPVVDAQGQPLGFVSKTDVIRQLHRAQGESQLQPWWDAERLAHVTVNTIMTPAVYSLTSETPIADAIAAMGFEGLHHLPVVDADGALVGMLSALDVLDWMARQAGYTPAHGPDGQIFLPPPGQ